MSSPTSQEVGQVLRALRQGEAERARATRVLFEILYDELQALASDLMRHERAGHTLEPTALVHETYLRLVDDSRLDWQDRAHFFGVAARAMRQILMEHARRRAADKRGGGWLRVTLREELQLAAPSAVEILKLDRALDDLSEIDERSGRIVELRIFGGMRAGEIAHVLGISERTIYKDWRVAKMWLTRELTGGRKP